MALEGKAAALALERGVTVTGRLVRGGKPVSGVRVGIVDSNRAAETFLEEIIAETGADGRFTLEHVAPQHGFTLYAKRDSLSGDGVTESRLVSTGASGQTLDAGELPVVAGRVVSGQIVLSDGKPLPPHLRVLVDRSGTWDPQLREVDANGRFSVVALDGEKLSFAASIAGYVPTGNADFNGNAHLRVGPQGALARLVFAPTGDARDHLRGQVMNAQGKPRRTPTSSWLRPPIRSGSRMASWTRIRSGGRVVSGEEGTFLLGAPKTPEDILLAVHPDGYAAVKLADYKGVLKLTPWGKVAGVARLGAQPAVGKTVSAGGSIIVGKPETMGAMISCHSESAVGADGTFSVDDVPEGIAFVNLTEKGQAATGNIILGMSAYAQSGETMQVSLGGPGALITGSVELPQDPRLDLTRQDRAFRAKTISATIATRSRSGATARPNSQWSRPASTTYRSCSTRSTAWTRSARRAPGDRRAGNRSRDGAAPGPRFPVHAAQDRLARAGFSRDDDDRQDPAQRGFQG